VALRRAGGKILTCGATSLRISPDYFVFIFFYLQVFELKIFFLCLVLFFFLFFLVLFFFFVIQRRGGTS